MDVDIVLGDMEISLGDHGIPGKIIYTPGHSMGSVSVLLNSGEGFVGVGEEYVPSALTPGLPILAENAQIVKNGWEVMLDGGAKTIYPAHGDHLQPIVFKRLCWDSAMQAVWRRHPAQSVG